jgi:Ca2+-binding EF-hand superfamily protein
MLAAVDPKIFEKRLSQGGISDEELAQLAGLKTGQIGEFREIFRIFDNNGDGFIDQDELRRMMQSLHFDSLLLSDEYYQDLIRRVKGSHVDLSDRELYFSVNSSLHIPTHGP